MSNISLGGSGGGGGTLTVGTTPIASGIDGALLYQGVAPNSGKLEEDIKLNWNPAVNGQLNIGSTATIGTFGPYELGVLGDVTSEFTVIIVAQHPNGTNFSFVPDVTTPNNYWNIWAAPYNFDWSGTIWAGKAIAGINSFPDGNSPISFDPHTVYIFGDLYLNPDFFTGAGVHLASGGVTEWTFTFPPNAGTNTYVLQTNGSGVTSWVPQSGGTLTVGTTPIASGTDTRVLFQGSSKLEESADFTWDDSGKHLGINGDIDLSSHVTVTSQAPSGSPWIFTFPPDAGTNSYVLQTNGSGVTSWAPTALILGFSTIAGTGAADGSVLFQDSGTIQENATKFFWDNSAAALGIGTNTPGFPLHVNVTTNETIVVTSTNTTGCSVVLDNTGGGGDFIEFFSSGSANGIGPGRFGVFDATTNSGSGASPLVVDKDVLGLLPAMVVGWNNEALYQNGAYDTGISPVGTAYLGIGNGALADVSGTLGLTTLAVNPVAIAGLPGTPTTGMIAAVNNALAPVVGTPVAGTGAAPALVWWNGAAWNVFAV